MSNIWKQQRDVGEHPNRNNFDLTFFSHSTFKLGYIYPVFRKFVYPGDSLRIDTAFDLKLMPLVFPLQSRMRAHMHYFYVRNKNLCDHWEDWIYGNRTNAEAPHPYVCPPDNKVQTGSIYDFLNVPTTVVTRGPVVERSAFLMNLLFDPKSAISYRPILSSVVPGEAFDFSTKYDSGHMYPMFFLTSPISVPSRTFIYPVREGSAAEMYANYFLSSEYFFSKCNVVILKDVDGRYIVDSLYTEVGSCSVTTDQGFTFDIGDSALSRLSELVFSGEKVFISLSPYYVDYVFGPVDFLPASSEQFFEWSAVPITGFEQYSRLDLRYYKDHQPLNAYPFRAYESIYYAYYANSVLQPLVIDGRKEYNKFTHTTADGEDLTDYHLFKRNYELDFLTSALPSPQSGNAPLVGMTALGDITIEDENGITTAHATTDSKGNISKVVLTSPAASVEHARTAMNIVAMGMSVNDFRSTNALQRFLENQLRSGYRYIDSVRGHFGVQPKDRELDMPEFIGGFSRDVQFGTVVSQADTLSMGGSDLGSFAGQGRVVGGANHSITHFCDDYGWIIGCLCIVPTPAYSQLLPREMKCPTNYLDYYTPEMAQIGMQPITYREVCPLQAYIDSLMDPSKSVDDVFGYQRPNYDMVGSVDEVHGEFRGSLRNYVINRIFDGRPELGTEFLEINPDEVNDIFANSNPGDDTIIGNILFDVKGKRPLPRVHMPGLGR